MNGEKKLRHEQTREHSHGEEHRQESVSRDFSSVEELLRYDAGNVAVPAGLAEKLRTSISREVKPAPVWWKRLLFRK
jgi:hypothetical protein